jgi:hypothetical protein
VHLYLNQDGLPDGLEVSLVRDNSPRRRDHDSTDAAIIVSVVQPRSPPEDIDRVVVTPQEAVRSKAGNLRARVAFDAVRKRYLKSPPGLPGDRYRGNLFCLEALLSVEERPSTATRVPSNTVCLSCPGKIIVSR